jgi:biotin carboxyl carrier protein
MGTAKVVSLSARPSQASHLCFEVDGILGALSTILGANVSAFDFTGFYATLASHPTKTGDLSRLLYDAAQMQTFVSQSTLAALRSEPRKAVLDKAVNARQNAYFAKYGSATAIITQMNKFYSTSSTLSKPNRLAKLSDLANEQANKLNAAYQPDRTGVVKTTTSVLNSTTTGGGSKVDEDSVMESLNTNVKVGTAISPPPAGAQQPLLFTGGANPNETLQEATSGETITNTGEIKQSQTITNTDYGYRTPYIESQAQNERAQISLIDQQFAQFMYRQNLPNLKVVFENELSSIDKDVYRLQVAYLNTILMSPISGTVTGIYKNPGDAVKAGEPVIRVENNELIFLVATLIYSGPIATGYTVTVSTTLFGQQTAPTTISGTVVAVRGRREEGQWEVVVECANFTTDPSIPILPLGYHFDYDDTTVSITDPPPVFLG